ncbi:MAG: patatin-like phospholipase family protein [Candidatus Micrarchaeota archaeon]
MLYPVLFPDKIIRRAAKEIGNNAVSNRYSEAPDRLAKTANIKEFYDVFKNHNLPRNEFNGHRELITGGDIFYLGDATQLDNNVDLDKVNIHLALSGAGIKFFAFLALVNTLYEHNIPITNIAGTSGGALAGLLIKMGCDFDVVKEVFNAKLLRALMWDLNFKEFFFPPLKGDKIMMFIDEILDQKYGNKTMEDIPGLYIMATLMNSMRDDEVSSFEKIVLSSEYSPRFKIYEALYASMSLPIFENLRCPHGETFQAIREGDGIVSLYPVQATERGALFDGGYMYNYPLGILLANMMPNDIVIDLCTAFPGHREIDLHAWWNRIRNALSMQTNIATRGQMDTTMMRSLPFNTIHCQIGRGIWDIGLTDFEKLPLAWEAGKSAALDFLRAFGIIQ